MSIAIGVVEPKGDIYALDLFQIASFLENLREQLLLEVVLFQ
jgi:hypothetical protein